MSMYSWFERFQQWFGNIPASRSTQGAATDPIPGGATMLRGLSSRNPEIADLQEEVAAEQQGRVALVGRCGELSCWLLSALREQAQLVMEGVIVQEGFFTLIALPALPNQPFAGGALDDDVADWETQAHWAQEEIYDALLGMDLILYLCDRADGWQPADDRWYSRLRALAVPILPVVVDNGPLQPDDDTGETMRRHLGVKPGFVPRRAADARDATPDHPLNDLVERMLAVRPRLAIPLAQEVPACRQLIARRVVRTGALMAMLVGAEPFPLLDLPLTVLVQWKMALQLAAIHGRPGVDILSQEMAGTVGLNLVVRLLAQQAFKLVPVVGWILSALLNFASTWLLGKALMNYYADDQPGRLKAAILRPGQKLRTTLQSKRWRVVLALPRLHRRRPDGAPASMPARNASTGEQDHPSPSSTNNGAILPGDYTQLSDEASHG